MADRTAPVHERETTPKPGGIGAWVPRKEDDRLLRGDGRFTDDVDLPHTLHMAVLRCPFPHARIAGIDVSAAAALPGVRQVLVGSDVAQRSRPITVLRPVPGVPDLQFFALAQDVAAF